ncbi:RDD family protein [Alteromonas sp. C1M14]|uniref:RDD family protein n=1 Tax=Alteromonas sp. C1M14 TaxID=2841567 RepID=UPI001C082A12|nr:RDD family protein [Alteromonas sp. C1M14]MBU2978094.1 RDD family protein [Alteromonas sp. C1M14]
MPETGKYSQLSLQELRAIAATVDGDAEPERAAQIYAEIVKKQQGEFSEEKVPPVADANHHSEAVDHNPNPTNQQEEERLASRGERFAAALIDSVVSILATIPFIFIVGAEKFATPSVSLIILSFAYGLLSLLVIHGYLLFNYGQTVGKRFLNIRIEDLSGRQASFGTIILKRYIPVSLSIYIPGIGGILSLVDVFFIFRRDRRCIHDHIAGTRVCRAPTSLTV